MPAAIPLIAGAFLAAGTVATALGVTAVAFTVAGLAVSWAAVATITGVALMGVAMLTMKRPKPGSSGGQLDSKLDIRAPIPVAYGRTATGGYITYQQSWGKKNSLLALVAVLSAGPVAGIETHKASDSTVYYSGNPTTGLATSVGVGDGSKLYKGKLRQRYQLGEAPASQTVTQASGLPLPGSPGKLSGLAHTISVLEYNTDAFPQGVPKNLWVLRGVKLYDPRKDSTFPGGSGSHRRDNHLTWEYSENPYLAALDWTFGRWWNGKKLYGIGARFEEVDVAAFVNGANVADANGWKVGGVVTTADNKFAVLSTILQSGGGVPTARGAQLSCTVNAPKISTFTLTSADIIGEVEIVNTTTWRDRSNTVVPSYREETQLWAMIAGEQVSSDVYVSEDAGERKTIEVDYPLVQQAAQAHQLATYELCNSREFLTFTATAKVRALNVRVGDAITVNIPEVAAVSKKCVVISREFNPGDLSVSLTLKSETDDKHPFALGQSQVAPTAPALNGYNPSNPGAPDATAWSVTGGEITAPDGSKMPAIIIAGETDDPNASNVIVEYRPAGSSVWLAGGDYPATARTIELTSVTAQTLYDVAIRYRTVRGVVSEPLLLSATAGAQTVNWSTVVTGEGKPESGATVGAPTGTYVGGKPVIEVISDLDKIAPIEVAQEEAGRAILDGQLLAEQRRRRYEDITHVSGLPLGPVVARIDQERVQGDKAITDTVSLIGQKGTDGQAFILNGSTVEIEPGKSLVSRLSELSSLTMAEVSSAVSARISSYDEVLTSRTGAIARQVDGLEAKIVAPGGPISAAITNYDRTTVDPADPTSKTVAESVRYLRSTVGGQTSEIAFILRALNGNEATAQLVLTANGKVSGLRLQGSTRSIAFDVKKFSIEDPDTGKSYFIADANDGGKVKMHDVEVDRIKAGSVDSPSLAIAATSRSSFATLSTDVACPYNTTADVISFVFDKVDADSVLKVQMFAQADHADDLIFTGEIAVDGNVAQTARVRMPFDNSNSRGSVPITPFAFVAGIAAGSHTVTFRLRSLDTEGPTYVRAGSTLEVTELRRAAAAVVQTNTVSNGGGGGGVEVLE